MQQRSEWSHECDRHSVLHRHLQEQTRCVVVLQLLGVDGSSLADALTHRKLTAKGEEVQHLSLSHSSTAYSM